MEKFVKGQVVVIRFPFSDLSGSKKRPALVLADLPGDDLILCQITSYKSFKDSFAVPLTDADFKNGRLPVSSYIRPSRIFTADKSIILKKVGLISQVKQEVVVEKIIGIISI